MAKGIVYLIPTPITNSKAVNVLPLNVIEITKSLRLFFVEDLRSARRFLRDIDATFPIDETEFIEIGKHSEASIWNDAMRKISAGLNAGIISEAGMPCVADPGQLIVNEAHLNGIAIMPLVGPSSIIMALASSGLNGQQFCFNGYLPIDEVDRIKKLKQIEHLVKFQNQTQIMMDTPFRNQKLYEEILKTLSIDLKLCVASNVSDPNGFIQTKIIKNWKNKNFSLEKTPTIFILGN